ncbi:MAG: carbohydrate kinase [Acidimicrobiia bacterium]|nr:carbohydrate kinase [Acidimicrobiia bacterium]
MGNRIFVAGEALIDLIPDALGNRTAKVGGGPANTAKAIARLGYSTSFIGGISSDEYGRAIEAELISSGVDLSLVYRGNESTALAIATLDGSGAAKYEFELDGTASFAFHESWLPRGEADVIHIGSVATMLEPGASELWKWATTKKAPIVFDPNVRPSIESDRDRYRASVERWIDIAAVVKLSEDDLDWLYGHESVVHSWLERGVSIVVVTRADKGMTAIGASFSVDVPAVPVTVVDTVGAGDTIGAVLVEGLLEYGLSGLNGGNLSTVLERAARAAAITCSRAGANPPWKAELDRN